MDSIQNTSREIGVLHEYERNFTEKFKLHLFSNILKSIIENAKRLR